jgi:hypothetical protein
MSLVKIIKTYGQKIYLENVRSFGISCSIYFYILNYNPSIIAKYDMNWNFINFTKLVTSPKNILIIDSNNTKRLFVTQTNGLCEIDENLNKVNSVALIGSNEGLYFNSSNSLLYVSTSSLNIIYVFSLNLTLIRKISVSLPNYSIFAFNRLMFVSTITSDIMVLQNEKIIYTFATSCFSIKTLMIDKFGIIALNCYISYAINNITFYYLNGSFTGETFRIPVAFPNNFGFDHNGNLILTSSSGIFVFSFTKPIINNTNYSFDASNKCNNKGDFLIFINSALFNALIF